MTYQIEISFAFWIIVLFDFFITPGISMNERKIYISNKIQRSNKIRKKKNKKELSIIINYVRDTGAAYFIFLSLAFVVLNKYNVILYS